MTTEEKKIKRREYMRKWYARKKNDPEFVARKNTNQRRYLARHPEIDREYKRSPHGRMLHNQASLRYYYKHREERLEYAQSRKRNMTDEQRQRRNAQQRLYTQRRNAAKRMDRTYQELIAKAESVAAELSKLFEQWDR